MNLQQQKQCGKLKMKLEEKLPNFKTHYML